MTPGENIRELRQQRGISAKDLAERAGLSAKALSEIENGHVEPRPQTIRRIADALGVAVHLIQPQARGEEVLVMLYRSLPTDKQRWVVQQLAAMAAGMEVAEDFPVPDEVLAVAS